MAQVSPAERIVSLFRVFQRARAHFTTRTRTVPLFFSFYTSVFLALSSFRAVAQHKLRLASCRLMFSHRGVKFSTTAGDANIQAELRVIVKVCATFARFWTQWSAFRDFRSDLNVVQLQIQPF